MSDRTTDDRRPRSDPPPPPPQAPDPKAAAALKEQQAASSIGAQIILDYNGEGSLGARGGAGASIEENTAARDAHLIGVGLDPASPSGPPSGQPVEPPPERVARATPAPSGKATRMSSLAAGLVTGDQPDDGGGGEGGGGDTATAPTNTVVPQVQQTGSTLDCTMGEWTGEPTSYSYAWQIDGAAAGTDSATHTVVAGDGGKSATCTVTATNAAGSATAPPSDALTITEPVTRGGRS